MLKLLGWFIVLWLVLLCSSIHRVEEGHIGVYYMGGKLLDRITEPGFHLKIPFLTQFENIQVTMQTDAVKNIPCGTSGGVVIYFDKVEVVNRLQAKKVHKTIKEYGVNYDRLWIFEKIHHEINQFCSKHTLQEVYIDLFDTLDEQLKNTLQKDCDLYDTGIEVITVRVTKPKIPEIIRKNYEQVEAEKTRLLISMQTQKVVEKEAETERLRATIEAKKQLEVSQITMEQQVKEREAKLTMSRIEDEIILHREKARTDAEMYHRQQLVEMEKLRNDKVLTSNYLQYEMIRSFNSTSKLIYFGEKIPPIFIDLKQIEQLLQPTNKP